jgi:hypothetical protein
VKIPVSDKTNRPLFLIEEATVEFPRGLGHGVLVQGGVILAASNSVGQKAKMDLPWPPPVQELSTSKGAIQARVLAVEPVNGIALFGPLDGSEFEPESERYRDFCDRTPPLALCLFDLQPFRDFPLRLCSGPGHWISGTGTCFGTDEATLFVQAEVPVPESACGGPIINENGELLAIIPGAWVGTTKGERTGASAARPHLCLPLWAGQRHFGLRLASGAQRREVRIASATLTRAE